MFVKPKAGLKIARPDTRTVLKDEGEEVPANTFWRRRLIDGDVLLVSEAPKEISVAPKKDVSKKESKVST